MAYQRQMTQAHNRFQTAHRQIDDLCAIMRKHGIQYSEPELQRPHGLEAGLIYQPWSPYDDGPAGASTTSEDRSLDEFAE